MDVHYVEADALWNPRIHAVGNRALRGLLVVDLLQDCALRSCQDDLVAQPHQLHHVAVDLQLGWHIDVSVVR